MTDITIRQAKVEDAQHLLAIYEPYIRNTAITFEYELPAVEEFQNRIQTTLEKYPYLVAEKEGQIVGYAYASAYKTRAAYDWSVETSIYLREDARGGGIGKQLYHKLEEMLRALNIMNLTACITYPNEESITFHEKNGYVKNAHFSKIGYKHGTWHDVIWMEKCLVEHPQEPPAVIPFSKSSLFSK